MLRIASCIIRKRMVSNDTRYLFNEKDIIEYDSQKAPIQCYFCLIKYVTFTQKESRLQPKGALSMILWLTHEGLLTNE